MAYGPHVFAGNPLDRGDRERRDEEWLAARAVDPTSRFLVMPDLDVPTTGDGDGVLRWLTHEGVVDLGIDAAESVFLGKQDGIAHFGLHMPGTDGAVGRLGSDDSIELGPVHTNVGHRR